MSNGERIGPTDFSMQRRGDHVDVLLQRGSSLHNTPHAVDFGYSPSGSTAQADPSIAAQDSSGRHRVSEHMQQFLLSAEPTKAVERPATGEVTSSPTLVDRTAATSVFSQGLAQLRETASQWRQDASANKVQDEAFGEFIEQVKAEVIAELDELRALVHQAHMTRGRQAQAAWAQAHEAKTSLEGKFQQFNELANSTDAVSVELESARSLMIDATRDFEAISAQDEAAQIQLSQAEAKMNNAQKNREALLFLKDHPENVREFLAGNDPSKEAVRRKVRMIITSIEQRSGVAWEHMDPLVRENILTNAYNNAQLQMDAPTKELSEANNTRRQRHHQRQQQEEVRDGHLTAFMKKQEERGSAMGLTEASLADLHATATSPQIIALPLPPRESIVEAAAREHQGKWFSLEGPERIVPLALEGAGVSNPQPVLEEPDAEIIRPPRAISIVARRLGGYVRRSRDQHLIVEELED